MERREGEIERLSSQLRGGRPPEALAMEGKIESNERMTAHLNIQVVLQALYTRGPNINVICKYFLYRWTSYNKLIRNWNLN